MAFENPSGDFLRSHNLPDGNLFRMQNTASELKARLWRHLRRQSVRMRVALTRTICNRRESALWGMVAKNAGLVTIFQLSADIVKPLIIGHSTVKRFAAFSMVAKIGRVPWGYRLCRKFVLS
ncbi:MAG: hypothetical protein R3C28_10905 [Pirellulaceae bacterium]